MKQSAKKQPKGRKLPTGTNLQIERQMESDLIEYDRLAALGIRKVPRNPGTKLDMKIDAERKKLTKRTVSGKRSVTPDLAAISRGAIDIRNGGASLPSYYASLDDPFNRTARLPYTNNIIQASKTTSLRMTSTLSVTVNANASTQLYFHPGHSPFSSLDDQANHCGYQTIDAANHPFGPLDYAAGVTTGIGGAIFPNIAINSATMTTAAPGVLPIHFDYRAPYAANTNFGHSRWALVSMGINIENVSAPLNRAGSVIMFKAAQKLSAADVATLTSPGKFKAYGKWMEFNDLATKINVRFTPVPEDVAFWHVTTGVSTTLAPLAGTYVWLQAGASESAAYHINVVYNYELAGVSLAPVSTEKLTTPASKDIMEPTAAYALNSAHADASMTHIAQSFAKGVAPIGASLSKIVTNGAAGASALGRLASKFV